MTEVAPPTEKRRVAPWVRVALALLMIALLGIPSLRLGGFTTDEPGAIFLFKWNLDVAVYGRPWSERRVARYDGTMLAMLAEPVQRVIDRIRFEPDERRGWSLWSRDRSSSELLRHRLPLRRAMTYGFFLLGCAACAGLVGLLWGWPYAWLGALAPALFPNYFGHASFNFKDVPFAALFTVATLLGALFVGSAIADGPEFRVRRRWTIGLALALGVVIGMLTAVRVGGIVVAGFPAVTHAILLLLTRGGRTSLNWPTLWRVGICHSVVLIVAWTVAVAFYPLAWSDPLTWIPRAIRVVGQYPWDKNVLFAGEYVKATALPPAYVPVWLAITTPVAWLILAGLGLALMVARLTRNAAPAQRAAILLLLAQLLVLPAIAIVKQSTLYDGVRHVLFMVPVFAIAASGAVAWLSERLAPRGARVGLGIVLVACAGVVVYDMVRLHPYEYVYFNRAFGGIAAAKGRYETDYWALSFGEAMRWINAHGEPGLPVRIAGPISPARLYADGRRDVASWSADASPSSPYYLLAQNKHGMLRIEPDAPIVFSVERDGTPFSVVRRVGPADPSGASTQIAR